MPFAYEFQVCLFYTTQNKYNEYFGTDASEYFVATVIEVCREMANEEKNRQRDHGYAQEQVREKWNNKTSNSCHICEKEIVHNNFHWDHTHVTGNIRRFTHARRKKNLRIPTHIPVVMHNLSKYDFIYFSEN